MHRVKVRVVEDALDANNTIASANRADFDREGVTVVNLMSAPGAGKTTLLEKALPGLEGVRPGVRVMDAGSGGLDLAYEIMRGYDALVLIDISRQGGEPGTLYVLEPDLDEIAPSIEDGDVVNPHGMDPQTVLRFVRAVGGWSGKVVIVACEPTDVEDLGVGLSPALVEAVERAIGLVEETVAELRTDAAYRS